MLDFIFGTAAAVLSGLGIGSGGLLVIYLTMLGEYEQINCYLDNDNAGRRTLEILRNHFGDKVKDCSGLYKGEKDLNEYLQKQNIEFINN